MNKREQIVQEAIDLFSTKGYEKTTITDIIKKSDVSRGGFYHHYKDKSEILDDIADMYLEDFSARFEKMRPTHSGNHSELITAVFISVIEFKIRQIPEWSILQKLFSFKGNHQIIMKIIKSFEQLLIKIYTDIIESGNSKGEFKVEYPALLAGLMTRELLQLLSAVQIAHKEGMEKLPKQIADHIAFLDSLFTRELGVKKLSVPFCNVLESYLLKMNMEAYDDYSISR
jgi:AcrR family transcriptional regulator